MLCQFSRIKPFGLLIFSVRTSRTCKEISKKDFWSSAEGRTLLTFNCSSHCSLVLSTWWSSRYGNVWTTDTPEGPQELLNEQCRWLLSCWYSKNFDAAYACSPAVQQPNIRHWIWSISLYQNRNSPRIFSHICTANTNILISFNKNIYAPVITWRLWLIKRHLTAAGQRSFPSTTRVSHQITLRMNCLLVKTGVISFIRCRVTRVVSLLSPCWLLRSPSWKSFPQTTCVQCRSRSR